MPRRRGPALLYITTDGTTVPVDTEAVADPRERALYRGLTARADELADTADADAAKPSGRAIGFALDADTERSGD